MMKNDGILLLNHRTLGTDAATVTEHIGAFQRHSRFPVFEVNTDLGFPEALPNITFGAVVLHYSLFSPAGYYLDERFREYLADTSAYTIAFFQDEHHFCRRRFAFLDRYAIDCVYTMLEPEHVAAVYGAHTKVPDVVSHLPGYVGEEMLLAADRFARPAPQRSVDIGYRGRTLAPYMGRGAREKHEIGVRFRERAKSSGLTLDIEVGERDRLYGDAWSRFVGNCRAFLGTESGVSVFDVDDSIRSEYETLLAERPDMKAEDYFQLWSGDGCEEAIPYRTISPRHFEAAAFRTAQILYEGGYSGIMEPWRHYIPLRKDFSNFDEVIAAFRDTRLRDEIVANAHRDLIASGAYTYARFLEGFDRHLSDLGLDADRAAATAGDVAAALNRDVRGRRARRRMRHAASTAYHWDFPGRRRFVELVEPAARPAVDRLRARMHAGRYTEPGI